MTRLPFIPSLAESDPVYRDALALQEDFRQRQRESERSSERDAPRQPVAQPLPEDSRVDELNDFFRTHRGPLGQPATVDLLTTSQKKVLLESFVSAGIQPPEGLLEATAGPLAPGNQLRFMRRLNQQANVASLMTKEIANDFESQQQQRQISREIKALSEQHRAGRVTDDALDDAIGLMLSSHGNALLSNPNFAELTGLKQQREDEIAQRVSDAEKQHGVKMKWDNRQNRPVFDRDAAVIEEYKSGLKDAEATREFRKTQNTIKDRDITLKHKIQRLSLWEQATAASEEETGQINQPYRNRIALMRKEIDRILGAEVPQFSSPSNLPVTAYPNQAALEAAWEAGTAKPGLVTIGGTPAILTADGQVNGR